jgi:HD-GYP domain-containing protein (c-di-GMP phosphodiesterase class II)
MLPKDMTKEQLIIENGKLKMLIETARYISEITDIDELLDLLVETACRVFRAEAGSILFLDDKKNELIFAITTGPSRDKIIGKRIPVGQGVSGTVAKNKEALLISDVDFDDRWYNLDYLSDFKTRSIICVPLKLKDNTVIGVMEILNSDSGICFNKDDLELFQAFADQAAVAVENARLYNKLERNYLDTIKVLANTIDAKDAYTRGHSKRVSEYSLAIGRAYGLNKEELKELQYGSLLHDIGKIGVPNKIIGKAGRLTDLEFSSIKQHPSMGSSIVTPVSFLHDKIPAIRFHHERYDGKGYPEGLSGDNIPLHARIVAVADTFDAMTSTRPYRDGLSVDIAINEIKKNSGTQFDPKVVDAFLIAIEKEEELFKNLCKKNKKEVCFKLDFPKAKEVFLIGDFNFWNAETDPMIKDGDKWSKIIYLAPGRYEYKFIVDGNWILDPENKEFAEDTVRGKSSVIFVNEDVNSCIKEAV